MLLDEPFSHLDLPNRLIVRDLLFDLVRQEQTQTACLLVTHDATDALSIADTLGIMRNGKLIQSGSPMEVYNRPSTAYSARMTGPANILKAKHLPVLGFAEAANPDDLICIRPEQIRLSDDSILWSNVSWSGIPATVRAVYFRGSHSELQVDVSRYVSLRLLTTREDVRIGESVTIQVRENAIWYLKE